MNGSKSALQSKVNWSAAIGGIAALAAVLGLDIDPETQAKLAASAAALSSVATIIFRTWFTTKRID